MQSGRGADVYLYIFLFVLIYFLMTKSREDRPQYTRPDRAEGFRFGDRVLFAFLRRGGRVKIKPSARELARRAPYDPDTLPSNKPFPSYRAGRVIVLDTKTTGFAYWDRIVSFAAIEVIDGVITGNQQSFVFNPQRNRDVHGLTSHYLSKQELFEVRAEEIAAFLGSDPIVAHNADFHTKFLAAEFGRCKLKFPPEVAYCTMRMFSAIDPQGKSLDAACDRLHITGLFAGGAYREFTSTWLPDRKATALKHRGAFIDATLCAAVFQALTSPEWPNAGYTPIDAITPTNEHEIRGVLTP
jgi:DNA polymerase III epsilon subunit-like protein